MHRIDSATAEADKFGTGKDGFTEGTPGTTAATLTTDDWFDGVQEEICNTIEEMDITLVKNTRTQMISALRRRAGQTAMGDLRTFDGGTKAFGLYGVAYSSSLKMWVALGQADAGNAYSLYSRNGAVWSESNNPQNLDIYDVIWVSDLSLFVAVGAPGGAPNDAYIITSPDGTTWTERVPTVANATTLGGVCWASTLTPTPLLVAVGSADGVKQYIITSPDGTTWTEQSPTVVQNKSLNQVCWAPDIPLFVAVGPSDGVDSHILTSPDGTTWTEQTADNNFELKDVCWSPKLSLFVAVGVDAGGSSNIQTSSNGTVWAAQTCTEDDTLYRVMWIDDFDCFVAVGSAVTGTYGPHMIYSYDGTTWTQVYGSDTDGEDIWGMAYGEGKLVLVGNDDGSDAYILKSVTVPFDIS